MYMSLIRHLFSLFLVELPVIITLYETRDLQERDIVYIAYIPRASQQGVLVLQSGIVCFQLTNELHRKHPTDAMFVYKMLWLFQQHNIEKRREDDFVRILEKVKYPAVNKTPLSCSTVQYGDRFEDLSTNTPVRLELQ